MKKIVAILLALVIVFSLSSCSIVKNAIKKSVTDLINNKIKEFFPNGLSGDLSKLLGGENGLDISSLLNGVTDGGDLTNKLKDILGEDQLRSIFGDDAADGNLSLDQLLGLLSGFGGGDTENSTADLDNVQTRVADFAGHLSNDEYLNVSTLLRDASEASGINVVVLTVSSLDGKDIQTYTKDFFAARAASYSWPALTLVYTLCYNEGYNSLVLFGKDSDSTQLNTILQGITSTMQNSGIYQSLVYYAQQASAVK